MIGSDEHLTPEGDWDREFKVIRWEEPLTLRDHEGYLLDQLGVHMF